MTDQLKMAQNELLASAGLEQKHLDQLLGILCGSGADYADIFFQAGCAESWMLEEGIVKGGSFHTDRGAGVRAMHGEKTGFAWSDDIFLADLTAAASAARSICRTGKSQIVISRQRFPGTHALYPSTNPLRSLDEKSKIALLQQADVCARESDPRVVEASVTLAASHETVLIISSDGMLAADVRPLVRMNISVVMEQNGRREKGYAGGGGRFDYLFFAKNNMPVLYAREAVRQALVNLEAVEAPAGTMPVVLGPGWPGVLLHEAVGHGLEGDFNRKGTSVYTGMIGNQVASSLCTIVDDGTLQGRRGSLNVDDEGIPTQCTVLIEKGKLCGYMQDRQNARLMGTRSTGNGRRESYAHLPIPRMTNTYMLPGETLPEEIIASVKKGLYAVNFAGGQVDTTSGKFVFSASEAYLIENGKVTVPVKGATLTGKGSEVLSQISMVGNNLELDPGIGVCGKDGQSVPVGVGQPTLKVDSLTVGGTVK